ncbi:MAG: PKD domain-containing protein [Bacteroidetes bacterium]|nr:PKD domain-containing protein [Bacteroidota bacterium]
MKKNLTFSTAFLFGIFILAILLPITGQSQKKQYEDNPNLDQIPQWYIDQIQKGSKAPSQVITVNDYDNFYLGVDFAEGHISENPTAPGEYFSAFNTDYTHRTQNGHDWDNATPVAWGTTIRGDVLTAFDSDGNLYYENMYGSPSILGCIVASSVNNGSSWSSVATAISGVDKNWMAADQTSGPYSNNIYTVMTSSSGGNFARSTNLGATFNNTATFATQSLPGMMVCVGPNGTTDGGSVYVVTNSGLSYASTYTFYQSTNGGTSFSYKSDQNFAGYVGTYVNGRNSVENMRTRPYPFIAADNSNGPYRGRLYVVYASNWPAGDGNKPDIWCRYSTNSGSSWSSAVKVNDDVNTQNNHQWAPAIWCDVNTGRLYVHWMDTRDTPTSDSAMMYASYSDNGGVSFVTNKAISNEKMVIDCSTCGGGGTPRYQGDYTGIVSNPVTSMSAWADFRWGSFASFTAYFPDYAMRLTSAGKSVEGVNTVYAEVPDVKLYTDDVIFTASMETPPSGSFSINFPAGNTLSSYPGSIPIEVTDNSVPSGFYTLTVTGKGPNGTPVHIREAFIEVVEPAPPVADFVADIVNPFIGNTVTFTDLSTNAPTSWVWSFNPATITYVGGTGPNSQNPQVQFNAVGNYNVTLVATNTYGSDSEVKINYIGATNCTYCTATSNNATEEWISNVTFNTINNSVNTIAGYEDFTYISTDVEQGNTYNASVSCGSTGTWTEYYWIFIDWNDDCDFDDPGESYDLGSTFGPGTLNTNISIPSGIDPGNKRMRVFIKFGSTPTSCETFSYGQVEDYTIYVMPTDLVLDLAVMLEGPYNTSTNTMGTSLNTFGYIPTTQPYNPPIPYYDNTNPVWQYPGTESVASIPVNVVDWVVVELRDASSPASATSAAAIGTQAAFVLNNGAVVGLDGFSPLTFNASFTQNLYAVIFHRNHLGIISNTGLTLSGGTYSWDFTSASGQSYGGVNAVKELEPGVWGMIAADGNANGLVQNTDETAVWKNDLGASGYDGGDFDLNGLTQNTDETNLWKPNLGGGGQVPAKGNEIFYKSWVPE